MMMMMMMSTTGYKIIATLAAVFFFLIIIIGIYTDGGAVEFAPVSSDERIITSARNGGLAFTHHHRKLLNNVKKGEELVEPNRVWSDKCSKSDIVISQGATEPLPSGIPTYTVEIMNVCTTGCNISSIHLSCGWFSSARLLNPRVFKRIRFDDCLVNDGKPLVNGHTLSFQYANTFRYPLTVTSVNC